MAFTKKIADSAAETATDTTAAAGQTAADIILILGKGAK